MANPSRLRYYCLRFSVLFMALALAAVLAEVGIRLFVPQVFPPHPRGMYTVDPVVGFVLTPGFEGRHERSEFSTEVLVNSIGLRGPEVAPRSPEALRVLCVGDSFTWGWGVEGSEAYPARLEQMLEEHYPNRHVEVLNAGVPGYGNDEALAWFRTRGAQFEPDLVVVQFFPWNDMDDNRAPAASTHEVRDGMLQQTRSEATDAGRPGWLRTLDRLKRRSHLLFMLSERTGYLAMRLGVLGELEGSSAHEFSEELGAKTASLLADLGRTAAEIGARSLYVYVPEKQQVVVNEDSPRPATELMAEAADEVGAPWLDLTVVFRDHPQRLELYYEGDAHWTALGNDVAASAIGKKIVSLGLLEPDSGLTAQRR